MKVTEEIEKKFYEKRIKRGNKSKKQTPYERKIKEMQKQGPVFKGHYSTDFFISTQC